MKKLFFFTMMLAIVNSSKVVADNTFLPRHSKWELTFSDEFDGNRINADKWHVYNSPMNRKYMIGRYSDNVKVQDGMLKLITRQPDHDRQKFTAGFIRSRTFTQKYGYFAVRMRYAGASGLNNAFWLVTQNMPPEKSFEIDVNEGHYPDEIVSTLHSWDKLKRQKSVSAKYYPPGLDLSADFHVYSVEWTSENIVTYFDGKKVLDTVNDKCHDSAYLLLSTAVTLFSGKISPDLDGSSMDVDWVRSYEAVVSPPEISDAKLEISNKILTWHAATDDVTPSNKLKYMVYGSKSSNISSYADAKENGFELYQLIGETEADLSFMPQGWYFLNVFAVDTSGSVSAYNTVLVKNDVDLSIGLELYTETISWDKIRISYYVADAVKYYVFISEKSDIQNLEDAFEHGKLVSVIDLGICMLTGLKSTTDYFINVFALTKSGNIIAGKMVRQKTTANFTPPIVRYDFTDPAKPGIDSSGNGLDAQAVNILIENDPVRYDNVAVFNGSDSYLQMPELNLDSNNITITAKVFLEEKQAPYSGIVFSRRELVGLWIAGKPEYCAYRWPGGAPYNWKCNFTLPLNEWFQLVLVITPNAATVYLKKDDGLFSSEYKGTHQPVKLNHLEIGRDMFAHVEGAKRYLRGRLDDICIYNRAMTREEVDELK